ncbi:MAG TPA: peptide deformylase [Candidatus Woesebacteria bacterium]|nr:peptide deformylase [Candidatus Woesebacteria bacterium]
MKILTTPDPLLRRVAKPVNKLDKKLENQIADLIVTLKSAQDPEGVGLAAPQVGIDRRLFIVSFKGIPEIFINPVLKNHSEAKLSDIHRRSKDRWLEGCLSVPRLWGFVDRPYSVEVEYLTPINGQLEKRHRKFEDVDASYVQHENDHLDGILFTDRILEQEGQILRETPNGLEPIEM